jgi:hypothetical protein
MSDADFLHRRFTKIVEIVVGQVAINSGPNKTFYGFGQAPIVELSS